ncbi:MAG: flagellar biosynthesis protein FlhA [Spirochaetales bacterium]|nr:flagellar biosynthesis protein FlhA [Spirochaetales bacterium]
MADVSSLTKSIFKQPSELFVGIGVVLFIMMMIIPLPPVVLDILMSINIVLSLLVVLIVLYTKHALEFSVFPTLLLLLTVFGLALNVSSTRLILVKGHNFDGRIVRAFGSFVVGTTGTEGYVIGIIIFIIIIIVQFLVITKGSTRVAEVAARFTLDALPGKQMAIEAEYNSGLLNEEEATMKKHQLQKEADFYGAMDGSSKFVSGNVKVGIVITLVNIIGGMVVGLLLHQESMDMAVQTYIPLAIGDGLVTQLPALLVSVSTGIIVTRSVSDASFGLDVTKQFSDQARPYWIAAAICFILGIIPGAGFPWYILIPLSALLVFLAVSLTRKQIKTEQTEKMKIAAGRDREAPAEITPVQPLDPLSLEIGYGLIPLVDKEHGAELLDRITRIRRESALDLGIVVPRIRIIDNMRLEPAEYCFKINGVEVGRGLIRMSHYLCINPGGISEEIPGEKTIDPAFGLPAIWISEEMREKAEQLGYTVVDPPSIIATHFTEIIKRHAAEILGRQGVKTILDTLKSDHSAVVDEVNKAFTVGEIHKVLQGLLEEQISVRNIVAVLETLADYADVTKNTGYLVEKVRQTLGRQICLQHVDDKKSIKALVLEPGLEQTIIDSKVETNKGLIAALEPSVHKKWILNLSQSMRLMQEQGYTPIVLCSEAARPLVKSSTTREFPNLVVLSYPEIVPEITVESLGEIGLND